MAAVKSLPALATADGTSLLVLRGFHRFLASAEIVQALEHQLVLGKTQPTKADSPSPISWDSVLTGLAIGAAVLFFQCNRHVWQSQHSQVGPNNAAVADTAGRTLEYWNQLRVAMNSTDKGPSTREELVGMCNLIAGRVEIIPTAGVDPDAVQLGLSLGSCLRNVSDQDKYERDPNRFFEAILRGADGDPFGTARDMGNLNQQCGKGSVKCETSVLERARCCLLDGTPEIVSPRSMSHTARRQFSLRQRLAISANASSGSKDCT